MTDMENLLLDYTVERRHTFRGRKRWQFKTTKRIFPAYETSTEYGDAGEAPSTYWESTFLDRGGMRYRQYRHFVQACQDRRRGG